MRPYYDLRVANKSLLIENHKILYANRFAPTSSSSSARHPQVTRSIKNQKPQYTALSPRAWYNLSSRLSPLSHPRDYHVRASARLESDFQLRALCRYRAAAAAALPWETHKCCCYTTPRGVWRGQLVYLERGGLDMGWLKNRSRSGINWSARL